MAAFIRRTARSPRDLVWGIWERGPDGLCCGAVGCHQLSREQGRATLGYWIRRRRSRRGYVSEASAAVLIWLFGPLGLARVSIEAAVGNTASLRVIRKLGFKREGLLRAAQAIPGRRGRFDWVVAGLIRGDLRQARPKHRALCGRARPWVRD